MLIAEERLRAAKFVEAAVSATLHPLPAPPHVLASHHVIHSAPQCSHMARCALWRRRPRRPPWRRFTHVVHRLALPRWPSEHGPIFLPTRGCSSLFSPQGPRSPSPQGAYRISRLWRPSSAGGRNWRAQASKTLHCTRVRCHSMCRTFLWSPFHLPGCCAHRHAHFYTPKRRPSAD